MVDGKRPRRRRSLFRVVAVGMAVLGLAAGMVFPGFVMLLGVPARIALRPLFVGSCLGAGIGVAVGNYALVRIVIGGRLRTMAHGIAKVQAGLVAAREHGRMGCDDLAGCRLDADSRDEIGLSARAFNQLLGVLHESQRSRDQGASAVGTAMAVLRQAGDQIGTAASAAIDAAFTASMTADQVGVSVQVAARRAAEVGGTLADTAGQARALVRSAGQAADVVTAATRTSAGVAESTSAIVERMGVIAAIARQIRLLALNAAIEATHAAGAGSGCGAGAGGGAGAGAGFRVVAAEIETLAVGTAAVTGEIIAQVADNHRKVTGMAEAMAELATFTSSVRDNQAAVAGRLAEQVTAIEEIVRATTQAEQDASSILAVIGRAAEATGATGLAAVEVRSAVEGLAGTAAQLGALAEVTAE